MTSHTGLAVGMAILPWSAEGPVSGLLWGHLANTGLVPTGHLRPGAAGFMGWLKAPA